MEFTATYVSLTYTLLAGLVIALSFVFSLKREVAVLQKEVAMNKENQDKINIKFDDKLDSIDCKLDKLIDLIMRK